MELQISFLFHYKSKFIHNAIQKNCTSSVRHKCVSRGFVFQFCMFSSIHGMVVVTHRPIMWRDLPPTRFAPIKHPWDETKKLGQVDSPSQDCDQLQQAPIDILLTPIHSAWRINVSIHWWHTHTHTHTTELAKSTRCSFIVCSITLGLKRSLQLNKNYICSPLFEPLNLELWHVNIVYENQSGQINTHTHKHTLTDS